MLAVKVNIRPAIRVSKQVHFAPNDRPQFLATPPDFLQCFAIGAFGQDGVANCVSSNFEALTIEIAQVMIVNCSGSFNGAVAWASSMPIVSKRSANDRYFIAPAVLEPILPVREYLKGR